MANKKKKKDKPKLRKTIVNWTAGRRRPGPISFQGRTQQLEQAGAYPILGCWVMAGWQERGLTPVIVARSKPDGRVVYAAFVVDIFCLGVKNVLWDADVSQKRLERQVENLCSGEPEACEASLAHEIIFGAVEYARRYGFEPYHEYATAAQLLDPAAEQARPHQLAFGRDGQPFFVAGPYDDAKAVINTLMRTAGEGNFHYVVGFGPADTG